MATGDENDFSGRLRAALPGQWFKSAPTTSTTPTPVLDAILAGLGSVWASLYSLWLYVTAQTRIATAYGVFLDFISADFFGSDLQRLVNEQDNSYRARIRAALFAPKGTRAAMIAKLQAVTGKTPWIFEPQRPADTGAYGTSGSHVWRGLAYGKAGGYGSMLLPGQCFIIAYRPAIPGIPNAAGYGSPIGAYSHAGSVVSGSIEYGSQNTATGAWTDQLIYSAIAETEQAGVIAWTHISN